MKNINFIEAVAERDIDLLLLEELSCNHVFRKWFLTKLNEEKPSSGTLVGVWHSVFDSNLGESDLILIKKDSKGRKKAVLIENKIDAVLQPDQGNRYNKRGKVGIDEGDWDRFITCCIAPSSYLESKNLEEFDSLVSYELLIDWFDRQEENTRRYNFKAKLIQEAIEQNRRGYQATPHEQVTQFWQQYWQLVQEAFSESNLSEPKAVPAGSDWPVLHSDPKGQAAYLIHKWRFGAVDLSFNDLADQIDQFKKQNATLLKKKNDLEIVATGNSLSVRYNVSEVDRFGDFESQKEKCREGIQAALELYNLAPSFEIKEDWIQ